MWFAILFAACFRITFANDEITITEYAFIRHKIVPYVIPVGPPQELQVVFPSGLFLGIDGKHIKYDDIKEQPTVAWKCPLQRYNMMCMFDLDEPSYGHKKARERLMWMVVNVEANYLDTGETLVEYPEGPFPVTVEKRHRYMILVYEQPWLVLYNITKIDKHTVEGRDEFSVKKLAEMYKLQNPIAGTFFTSTVH